MADIFEFPTGSKRDWNDFQKVIKKRYNESAARLGFPPNFADPICERMKDDFFKYDEMVREILSLPQPQVKNTGKPSAEEVEIIIQSIFSALENVKKKLHQFFGVVIADRAHAEWEALKAEGRGEE
jgi:hypothetical protein